MFKIKSHSENQTKALAAKIAKQLKPGDIVLLQGNLGAGKTTFVKGIAKHFKTKEEDVTSPSYVLMNIYGKKTEVYHFDFYRLDKMAQINTLGYEEYFYGDGVCFIEWPERLGEALPVEYLKVELIHKGENREIKLSAKGERYKKLISKLT